MVEQLTPATIKIYFYLPAASMFRGELKCSLKGILNCHKENGGSKDSFAGSGRLRHAGSGRLRHQGTYIG